MKIYYLPNGEIWNALWDSEILKTEIEPTTQEFEIDEIVENSELLRNLSKYSTMRDESNLGRWYIENGELYERENWAPYERENWTASL